MTLHSLPSWLLLVPAVLSLQIGTFVLIADPRTLLNRLVFLTSLAVSLWNLGNIWDALGLAPGTLPWLRLGGIFLPILSLHVLVAYRRFADRTIRRLLAAGYAWAVLIMVTAPRQMLFPPPTATSGLALSPYMFTAGFLSYTMYFSLTVACSAYLIAEEYPSVRGPERVRLTLVALTSAAAILSAAAGLFLHHAAFHAFNAVATLVYLAALAWAVVRYHLGNANLFLRSSAVYSVVLALVSGLYVVAVFLLAAWLQSWRHWNPLIVVFFCTLVTGPLFYPLQDGVVAALRRFFPLPRDLYYNGMKHFLPEMNVLTPLPDLARSIVNRLASLFELSSVALLVRPAKSPPFLVGTSTGDVCPGDFSIPVPADEAKQPGLLDLKRWSGLPLVSLFPLMGRGRQVGLLALGRHPAGELLTAEEQEVLVALTRQAGVALENADLYSELMAVKNHYLTVVESSAQALLVVTPEGLVEDANPAAAALFGPRASLLGQSVEAATGAPALRSFVDSALASCSPVTGRELMLPRPDGTVIPYAATVSPLLDPVSSKCTGAVITLADLSAIQAMQRQVERAERLAALGQLTAGLAHELRNGLNNISGYATMLADALPASDPLHRFPAGILEDAADLESMLNRFLSFAREAPLTSTAVALPRLIAKILGRLQPELHARRIILVNAADRGVPPVHGDPAQLAQALTNVLLNAIEAMGRTGGVLTLKLTSEGQGIELCITDTGPGIPPEEQELVFNPFFTTKPDGTGLGLPITHRIITQHGGEIRLDSRPGRGTSVIITLPAADASKTDDLAQRRSG